MNTREKAWRIPLLLVFVCNLMSAPDWPTYGHDSQRTGWSVEEKTISLQNAATLELKWKTHLQNEARFLNALTAPIVAADITTPRGPKTLVYVAGTSNNLYALDAAYGNVVWTRVFPSRVLSGKGFVQGTLFCPN